MEVYPLHSEEHLNKPLWLVCGYKYSPEVIPCLIRHHDEGLVIWGYSVYRNSPGFRTYGTALSSFYSMRVKEYGWNLPLRFFDDQDSALLYVKELTRIHPSLLC